MSCLDHIASLGCHQEITGLDMLREPKGRSPCQHNDCENAQLQHFTDFGRAQRAAAIRASWGMDDTQSKTLNS